MSKRTNVKPLTLAVGAAIATSMAIGTANAGTSVFGMTALSSGYMVDAGEGKCGEGKCGGDKVKEATCGGDKEAEGKCGEGKCGGEKDAKAHDKGAEGKCGEGKCGGSL